MSEIIVFGTPESDHAVWECIPKKDDRQWRIGDYALKYFPMRTKTGPSGENLQENLKKFAKAIGVEYKTVLTYRDVASAWKIPNRLGNTSFTIHMVLMKNQDLMRPGLTVAQARKLVAEANGTKEKDKPKPKPKDQDENSNQKSSQSQESEPEAKSFKEEEEEEVPKVSEEEIARLNREEILNKVRANLAKSDSLVHEAFNNLKAMTFDFESDQVEELQKLTKSIRSDIDEIDVALFRMRIPEMM